MTCEKGRPTTTIHTMMETITVSDQSFHYKASSFRLYRHLSACLLLLSIWCTIQTQAFTVRASNRFVFGDRTFRIDSPRYARAIISGGNGFMPDDPSTFSIESTAKVVRNFVRATIFAIGLTASPLTSPTPNSSLQNWFVAHAEQNKVTLKNSEQNAKPGEQQSLLTAPTTATPTNNDVTLVDQVWTLIAKYFIDQSFNGQASNTNGLELRHVIITNRLCHRTGIK